MVVAVLGGPVSARDDEAGPLDAATCLPGAAASDPAGLAVMPAPQSPLLDLDRAPARGPAAAAVTIVEFSDFQCPFCRRVAGTVQTVLRQYPGQVRWVFKHFPLPFHRDAALAHEAALAAGAQGKFWEMHDLIFANQHAIARQDLLAMAGRLGLDATRFAADLDSGRHRALVAADIAEGRRLGIEGTPTFLINGHRVVGAVPVAELRKVVEELGAAPRVARAPRRTPDVALVPSRGPSDALVVVEEFTDLQSPYSARMAPVIDRLLATYRGQVRHVFRHNPLAIHPDAALVHEAAVAAAAQGKFWELRDRLTRHRGLLRRPQLVQYARQVGLDVDRFVAALEQRTFKDQVDADLQDADRRGVSESPTFFVNGRAVLGVQPYAMLADLVDEAVGRPTRIVREILAQPPVALAIPADAPSTGPLDAPITIVEFMDLECPFSARANETLRRLEHEYPGRVRRVFRHFPLAFHRHATVAHESLLSAAERGKFEALRDAIFATQDAMEREQLVARAVTVGLEARTVMADLDSGRLRPLVERDSEEGQRLGVSGTPTIFVNGYRVNGAQPYGVFKALVDHVLAPAN